VSALFAELARLREQTAQQERLVAMATLAAGAAHELNTPLGTIALVASELRAQFPNGEVAGDLALVVEQVERCRKILANLNPESLNRQTRGAVRCRLSEIVARLDASLGEGERARLCVEHADNVDEIPGPPDLIEKILHNLVRNAFDASPSGESVQLNVSETEKTMRFAVSDRGKGLTPDEMTHVFEPFFTTKDPNRGMGLGLFLSKLLSERLGGSLQLRSTSGLGTVALLEIPR
jgi:two-component system sensor histidine kinase RegB